MFRLYCLIFFQGLCEHFSQDLLPKRKNRLLKWNVRLFSITLDRNMTYQITSNYQRVFRKTTYVTFRMSGSFRGGSIPFFQRWAPVTAFSAVAVTISYKGCNISPSFVSKHPSIEKYLLHRAIMLNLIWNWLSEHIVQTYSQLNLLSRQFDGLKCHFKAVKENLYFLRGQP